MLPCEEEKPLQPEEQPKSRTEHTYRKRPVTKTEELLSWFKGLSLESLFNLWGRIIGDWPLAFLISGLILCCASVFMMNLHLKDNVRDGYTPSTSRSRHETDIYREFLHSEGDPVMTTVLITARDGGSMHRLDHLKEAVQQSVILSKKLSVNTTGTPVTYDHFCGHYCKANSVLNYFLLALTEKQKSLSPSLKLTYPIAELHGVKMHLERNFYGVKTTENDTVTNIDYIQLISLSFLAEVKSTGQMNQLAAWELEVFRYCTEYTNNKENLLEILVIGAEIVDTEMNKDGQKMAPYFATGFSVMFCFVCLTVVGSSLYYDKLSCKMLVVAVACALVPILAITTTLGLSTLLGNRTNSLMLIMPFLIMGIGVNDSFLTLHAWLRQPKGSGEPDRLGRVLQEVGPSITTTTLTNVITFIIGWTTPTEEISIFCLGSALALGFAYIYTIIIFCPILVYCAPQEKVTKGITWRNSVRRFLKSFVHYYCTIIKSKYFVALLGFGYIFYFYFGVLGTFSMTAKLDTGKILPSDSPVRKPNRLIESIVWKEYYPVTIVVNNPVEISDPEQLSYLNSFIEEFEATPTCRGKNFTIFWLRDYEEYFNNVANVIFDYDADEAAEDKTTFGYSKLDGFLGSPLYEHNKAFIDLDEDQSIPVRKFSLVVVYENNTSWEDRIDLMIKWRNIVDKYPRLNATVWNVNSMFVDQMLSLKNLTYQTCLITLACMAVVCALFIQNPIMVAASTLAIASISIGVMGYLSFWNLDLDPVSLCSVLISIGMAVDFVAHTTYHYQLSSREVIRDGRLVSQPLSSPYDRLRHTLTNIAWPMTQAGISTVICILPLVTLQNYIPLVFVKTITLVVIWGLFHGLCLLPAVLAQLPLGLLEFNIFRIFSSPSTLNEQELAPLSMSSIKSLGT